MDRHNSILHVYWAEWYCKTNLKINSGTFSLGQVGIDPFFASFPSYN
jgi:hypothetical protein